MDAVLRTVADQNNYHRFPALNLLRIPRMALDVRKLSLAVVALLLMQHGHWGIDQMFPTSVIGQPLQQLSPFYTREEANLNSKSSSSFFSMSQLFKGDKETQAPRKETLFSFRFSTDSFFFPWASIYEPIREIVLGGNSWNRLAYLWTHLIWSLFVWAFLGLGICRLSALEFVTDTRASLKSSTWFGLKNGKSVFIAAQISLFSGMIVWLILSLCGLVDLWKPFGTADSLVTLFWFIPWLIALPLALLFLGSVAGWPLMLATISVEGSDGFDGFSRPFSYIFSKPLRYVLYWFIVALLLLVAGWFFESIIMLVELLAQNYVLGAEVDVQQSISRYAAVRESRPFLHFWIEALSWLFEAFRISLFFSAGTIIYFLMRKADDAISLDEIYTDSENGKERGLPLAGMAATSHPLPGHDAPVVPTESSQEETASEEQRENQDDEELEK
ncbi:MAG: hypothetical protein KDA65_08745 [Planctomycetaceae bacterium]|nr:hypothetical protein [Planctomycetaceae bacterium]